ncbi:hypothetical protein JZ751_002931 [Albula glossodonta]|uniref:Uncharacterized protein n=1 Tax=Albula glossodonta TaxID=121402 RepID=A0A8T2N9G0_9TELE|nr:hypothetical protein JZ751_002931 [Albula glossodonta]
MIFVFVYWFSETELRGRDCGCHSGGSDRSLPALQGPAAHPWDNDQTSPCATVFTSPSPTGMALRARVCEDPPEFLEEERPRPQGSSPCSESGMIVKTAKEACAEGLVVSGGGKEGIFIKEVKPESPAAKHLSVQEGRRRSNHFGKRTY